ncbi:amidohydrolase [Palleronia sediminis]|uniref:Amidohydrolase n=1 Tax=Palleronia sediminis TaxID=2547833 RepID=A0A4R6A9V9_9RHOB|nr:M20 aminoacylase family protein [Palleronia sediminis]TDL79484.1 amidohydrolase [Palleronia sediminis]
MPIPNSIAALSDEMRAWRRDLHRHPEIGFDCHRTARFVADCLRKIGVDVLHEGVAQTGVVAVIEGRASGRCIGLRADMDALPMDETGGADHASTVPGAMHACGHDGHTAMLLGAATYLAATRNFAGRVVLMFQPAEEAGGGGRVMVEEGVLDRFDIDEVYALHNAPNQPFGSFHTAPGPIMAAVDEFDITLRGVGGHAARPHDCVDPIPAALRLGQALDTVVSRNADPIGTLVVSVTQIHAGSAMNVIPDTARIAGTVRSFAPEMRDMAERRIREIAQGIAAGFGVAAQIDYVRDYPATVNHAREAGFAADVAAELVGEDLVRRDCPPSMGAEDFGYMLAARPGAYLLLGQGEGPGCHHPAYDFNDDIAPLGAAFFARLAERRLRLT